MTDATRVLTVACAHRQTWELMRRVTIDGVQVRFAADGTIPSNQMYSLLAGGHDGDAGWDIGEMAFSTYLMSFDLGSEDVALPVFPARMLPHQGVWVRADAGIREPADLVGKRVACNSFGTNYSVWWRGILAHQYDVPVERITWVQSVAEHRADYHLPGRYIVEVLDTNMRSPELLAHGLVDAVTMAGASQAPPGPAVRPLFADSYAEARAYAERSGFVPLNTVLTMRRSVVERDPDLPRLVFDAMERAQAEQAAVAPPEDEAIYRQLERDTTRPLLSYGFLSNRIAIREMLAYCYEQGIVRKLFDPAEPFLLTDT